jgi:hypothetical protein
MRTDTITNTNMTIRPCEPTEQLPSPANAPGNMIEDITREQRDHSTMDAQWAMSCNQEFPKGVVIETVDQLKKDLPVPLNPIVVALYRVS